jgi:hypothetical protein
MFKLRTLDAQIGGLRARDFELGLGEIGVLAGGETGALLDPGQLQRLQISGCRGLQELLLLIQNAQLKIVHRHLRLHGQPHVPKIR